MDFWGKNVQLEQKKIILENKNKRYNLLNNEVFTPLSINLSIICNNNNNEMDREGFTKLFDDKFTKLDLSDIKNNRHYIEAHKHLMKDITCDEGKFDNRFNEIEKKVKDYNKDLDDFRNHKLDKWIKECLDKYNLKFTDIQPKSNELDKSLLNHLKKLWFDDDNFEIKTIENELRVENNITLAIFSTNEERTNIENCINELKKYDKIIKKIEYFKNEPVKICDKGKKLSKDIEDKIIKMIEIDDYTTTCDMCEKLNDFKTD